MKLEDLGVITALKPIGGGWRYMQSTQGRFERIPHEGSADTGAVLVEQVRQFRINEGIDIGDPVYDVADYIRKVSPPNDKYKGRAQLGVERVREIKPLIQVCREWLDATAARLPEKTDLDDATARAGVCQHCKHNVAWEVSACSDCNAAVTYKGICLRGRTEFAGDGFLRACRLHGVHLPTAIFIDRAFLPPRHEQAPEACWVPKQS